MIHRVRTASGLLLVQFYGFLLWLYPANVRQEVGPAMLADLQTALRCSTTARGLRFWCFHMTDLLAGAMTAHEMTWAEPLSSRTLRRIAGVLLVMGLGASLLDGLMLANAFDLLPSAVYPWWRTTLEQPISDVISILWIIGMGGLLRWLWPQRRARTLLQLGFVGLITSELVWLVMVRVVQAPAAVLVPLIILLDISRLGSSVLLLWATSAIRVAPMVIITFGLMAVRSLMSALPSALAIDHQYQGAVLLALIEASSDVLLGHYLWRRTWEHGRGSVTLRVKSAPPLKSRSRTADTDHNQSLKCPRTADTETP